MALSRCAHGTSAARSFVQIASRRSFVASAPPPAPLDFLVPRGAVSASGLRTACRSRNGISPTKPSPMGFFSRRSPNRSFTASAARNATRCALHPRTDDDGNDMVLEITPRAAKRLSEIRKKDNNPNLALRIQVESGGCHGFQYLISLITVPGTDAQGWSSAVAEDDSIFQYFPDAAEGDSESEGGPIVVLDEPSLQLLKGSKVDFTMELIGSQFKIVDNPYATSSCGCGTSFDIKM